MEPVIVEYDFLTDGQIATYLWFLFTTVPVQVDGC